MLQFPSDCSWLRSNVRSEVLTEGGLETAEGTRGLPLEGRRADALGK